MALPDDGAGDGCGCGAAILTRPSSALFLPAALLVWVIDGVWSREVWLRRRAFQGAVLVLVGAGAHNGAVVGSQRADLRPLRSHGALVRRQPLRRPEPRGDRSERHGVSCGSVVAFARRAGPGRCCSRGGALDFARTHPGA